MIGFLVAAPFLAAFGYAAGYCLWALGRWPRIGQVIAIPGGQIHTVDVGPRDDGTPLLLLHGASSNAREWLTAVAPALKDRRVIAIDRPGLGHSSDMTGADQLAGQARAAIGVLDALKLAKVTIVAHSLGSATALRIALDAPERVAGLVLAAPASHPYPGGNAWYVRLAAHPLLGPLFCWLLIPIFGPAQAQSGVQGTFAPATAPANYADATGLGLLFLPWTFASNARQVHHTNAEFSEQAPRYPEIRAPLIILSPDRDNVVSPTIHAKALAAAIPQAELRILPGAGHGLPQTAADAIAEAVHSLAHPRIGVSLPPSLTQS